MNLTSATSRGCGTRQTMGLYMCTGTSPHGRPIEAFIWDPPIPWHQGSFRGCQLYERKDGLVDVLVWVGEEYYTHISDYIEEGRQFGFSRRVSTQLDLSRLTPGRSRMIYLHRRVITPTLYKLHERVGEARPRPERHRGECDHAPIRRLGDTQCTFALWELGALEMVEPLHICQEREDPIVCITTPSVSYDVQKPIDAIPFPMAYSPGMFAATPITHFEFINPDGQISKDAHQSLGRNVRACAVVEQ